MGCGGVSQATSAFALFSEVVRKPPTPRGPSSTRSYPQPSASNSRSALGAMGAGLRGLRSTRRKRQTISS